MKKLIAALHRVVAGTTVKLYDPSAYNANRLISSHFNIKIDELPEAEYKKKAFQVDSPTQFRKNGICPIVQSKKSFGTQQSGGAANILDTILPNGIGEVLSKNCKPGKFYRIDIGSAQGGPDGPTSLHSYGETFFLDGNVAKKIHF